MKKNKYLLLLFTLFLLLAASCQKGATGPQGPAGPQGPVGPQGPAGANGTMIYSGATAPALSIGALGDFYINLSTGILYGPKTATGWGTGISLIGPQGSAGTNGATIYSGTTVPSASTGAIGDFYVDLTTAVFYGPKTSTGWGTGIPLIAALGPNYPFIINTIITPAIIDTLQKYGQTINAGLTPPTVSGVYLISPNYCLYDNSGNNDAGKTADNYEYEFGSQNSTNFTITVNYSDAVAGGNDVGSDVTATYISGSGSSFTIYAQTTGTDSGIPYTSLQVISGQIVSGAIDNFQLSVYLVSKGSDPTNLIVPVGTTRIFKDEDGVSPAQSTFISVEGVPHMLGLIQRNLRAFLSDKKL